jgi:twitching motility protein PilI
MNQRMFASSVAERDTSPTRNDVAPNWLGPVEALTRFAPTERIALDSASGSEEADVRYAIRVGDIGLLIGARVPTEFVLPVPVSRVPNTPDWFAGLINLRGAILPVFDIESMVNVDHDSAQLSAPVGRLLFLVLDRGERAAALKIHGFPQALNGLTPLDEAPPLPAPLDVCVSNAMVENDVENDSVWFEFDHLRLFDEFSGRLAKSGTGALGETSIRPPAA